MTKARDIASYQFKQPVIVGPNDGTVDARVIFRGNSTQGEGWVGVPSWDTDAIYMYVPNGSGANLQAMKVHHGGQVQTPKVPVATGHFNAITSSTGAGQWTTRTFQTSGLTANGGMGTANNRVTVPVAGWYHASTNQMFNSNAGVYMHILRNGATQSMAYASNANHTDLATSMTFYCSANDYIEFKVYGDVTYAWPNDHANWTIHYVG